jgi:hypothetical protein
MVVVAAVGESNSDSGGGNGDSDGWGGGIGSKGDSDGSRDDSNDGDNGGSCDSDGITMAMTPANGHDNDDMTVAAVRAAGSTKTTTVTAMAGGTNNNQLKAQFCPAHDGDKDDMPGMCLAVVVVVEMSVWEGGSATAMVEEPATAAADEADDGWGGQCFAVYSFLVRFFFHHHRHCH